MTNDARNDLSQGVPALVSAPIGEAKSSGLLPALGRAVPGSPQPAAKESERASERPRPLRIGDKVRSLVNDSFVSVGLTGLVVNVAPPRIDRPARARILWDNETQSMADATTFERVSVEQVDNRADVESTE